MRTTLFHSFLALLVLCYSPLVFGAGIQLTEFGVQVSKNNYVYAFFGSQEYPSAITPQLIISEAKATLTTLQADLKEQGYDETQWPGVVTAIKIEGKKIYFASSLKGSGSIPGSLEKVFDVDPRVVDALKECSESGLKTHNNQGKCGEVMDTTYWFLENPSYKAAKLTQTGKLMVTVTGKDGATKQVIPPCTDSNMGPTRPNPFGCREFVQKIGFNIETEVLECEAPAASGGLGKRACPMRKPKKPTKPQTVKPKGPKTKVAKPKNRKPTTPKKTPKAPTGKKLPKQKKPVGPGKTRAKKGGARP